LEANSGAREAMSIPNASSANNETPFVERKIKWASTLIGAGLFVQLSTLLWVHPIAFVLFLVVGCPLLLAGIVVYLLSLLD
jgi:hypothetical protein